MGNKKVALSSKEKEIWTCECGKENNAELAHCSKCKKDIYGFEIDAINPAKAIEILREKYDILKEVFS